MGVLGYCMNIKVLNITKDLDIYIIFTRYLHYIYKIFTLYLQDIYKACPHPEIFQKISVQEKMTENNHDGDVYSYFRNEEAQHYKFIKSFIKHAFIKSY